MAGDSKVARAHLAEAGVDRVPDGWDVVELGDLLAKERGISVGVMYPGDHFPDGVPLIKAGDLSGSVINPRPDFRISKEKHQEYRRTELQGGELVMTLVGNVGQCAVVPPCMVGWNTARAVAVMRLADPSDAHFVQQCLLSRPLQHLMDVWCNTTVQATLNLKEIRQLPVPWPPKPRRDAIAAFGRTLDDKVELNQRTNETLEAISRALFKSWFVDFDPVRAKADGRQPTGIDAETANLFPSELVSSSLGRIPAGWRVGQLQDILHLQRGFDLPSQFRVPGPYPVVTGSGLTSRHAVAQVKGPGVVTGRSGVLGKVFLMLEDFWPLNTALWVKEFRAGGPCFAYFALQQVDLSSFNAGSAVPTLNRNHVHDLPWLVPPRELADAYERRALPLFEKRDSLAMESQLVANVRDELLPRLLSGDSPIVDLERAPE